MYNTQQSPGRGSQKVRTEGLNRHSSPQSSLLNRRSAKYSPARQLLTSGDNDFQQATILHSQAIIERSRATRLNASNSHTNLSLNADNQTSPIAHQYFVMASQNSPTGATFEETIREEMVARLREQLEDERKRHRETKRVMEDAMQNFEQQTRVAPAQAIALETSKAVDEIINKGALSHTALTEELAKLKQQMQELQHRDSDLQK